LALKCLLLFFVSIKVARTSTFVIQEESTTTECWLRYSSLQEEERSRTREFRLLLLGFYFPTTSWSRLGDSQIFSCILSFPIVGGLPRSCMCACVSLSHPRRSFEASELEGNTQRAQRHLWRPRKNPIRRLNQVRLVLPLPFLYTSFLVMECIFPQDMYVFFVHTNSFRMAFFLLEIHDSSMS
jgi:hypothetical protein